MRYRINKRTGDCISEIGLGSAYIPEVPLTQAIPALRRAYEGGINYYDLAAGDGKAFPMYGEAFADVRKNILYQVHFGADYSKGTYGWSLDLETIKRSINRQLTELRTVLSIMGLFTARTSFQTGKHTGKMGCTITS